MNVHVRESDIEVHLRRCSKHTLLYHLRLAGARGARRFSKKLCTTFIPYVQALFDCGPTAPRSPRSPRSLRSPCGPGAPRAPRRRKLIFDRICDGGAGRSLARRTRSASIGATGRGGGNGGATGRASLSLLSTSVSPSSTNRRRRAGGSCRPASPSRSRVRGAGTARFGSGSLGRSQFHGRLDGRRLLAGSKQMHFILQVA